MSSHKTVTETMDSDMDGVGDNADAFPNDANETVDFDGDGVGDNTTDNFKALLLILTEME